MVQGTIYDNINGLGGPFMFKIIGLAGPLHLCGDIPLTGIATAAVHLNFLEMFDALKKILLSQIWVEVLPCIIACYFHTEFLKIIRSGQLSNIKNSVKLVLVSMPCWTLAELKAVGNHIVKGNHALKEFMSSQAIEERYKRLRE